MRATQRRQTLEKTCQWGEGARTAHPACRLWKKCLALFLPWFSFTSVLEDCVAARRLELHSQPISEQKGKKNHKKKSAKRHGGENLPTQPMKKRRSHAVVVWMKTAPEVLCFSAWSPGDGSVWEGGLGLGGVLPRSQSLHHVFPPPLCSHHILSSFLMPVDQNTSP